MKRESKRWCPPAAALGSKWGKEVTAVREVVVAAEGDCAPKGLDQISKCFKDNEIRGENEIELRGDGL